VLGVVTRQKRQSLLAVSFTTVARRGDSQGAFFVSACEQLTGVAGTNIWERLTTLVRITGPYPVRLAPKQQHVPFPLSP